MTAAPRALDIRYCIYKRLETDAEFCQRVNGGPLMQKSIYGTWREVTGAQLDEALWNIHRMQRRIVEVAP